MDDKFNGLFGGVNNVDILDPTFGIRRDFVDNISDTSWRSTIFWGCWSLWLHRLIGYSVLACASTSGEVIYGTLSWSLDLIVYFSLILFESIFFFFLFLFYFINYFDAILIFSSLFMRSSIIFSFYFYLTNMSNLFRTNVIEITNILFIIKYLYHPNLYMKIGEQN